MNATLDASDWTAASDAIGAGLLAIAPGPFVTVQDGGRLGWQRFGVPRGGAMDPAAFRLANVLVGNPPETAVLEFATPGGEYQVVAESCRLSVTGGDFVVFAGGERVSTYRSLTLRRGMRIRIGGASNAVWGYLAVAGGFALKPRLGSLSTHVRSGIGPVGRPIRDGDMLPLRHAAAPAGPDCAIFGRTQVAAAAPIRVILGPQAEFFTAAAIGSFLGADWRITYQYDRMGYHLSGPPLEHARGYNIISDGVLAGSVQVPGSGQPIVLLRDCQPTGGYPKIATVISVDVGVLAQRRPAMTVRFQEVGLAEATRLRAEWLDLLARRARPMPLAPVRPKAMQPPP